MFDFERLIVAQWDTIDGWSESVYALVYACIRMRKATRDMATLINLIIFD